ncbi:phosphoribosylaminoimidazolesuccinocarboxamide synthase [Caldalkalibacillus salinus]|uniref:phosphoribosylaminoimidazolesuccinocarboxamide synthase n=1 Tax=Caldalkalibacillus salinus TaxID=2803787 RepID=UPI001921A8C9|nr:phosphoribosylaminoimidazolesuccinocarboxamide synthase [Caldalkalibacillus salinus]
MNRGPLLYEGKAKRIYQTDEASIVWVEYKDDATAFNGDKKGAIKEKGVLNNRISGLFFKYLQEKGISTHFVQQLSEREQLVQKVEIIPVEVVVRNRAAGSMAKRLGLEEGTQLPFPIVEYYYKDDALGDPLITEAHVHVLGLATEDQLQKMKEDALQINRHLQDFLLQKDIELIDFKLEFGLTSYNDVILADEISPDTCRFWDVHTQKKLDKDRFRRDLGDVEEAYEEILTRLGGYENV